METTKVKKFDYTDAKRNISKGLDYLSMIISAINYTNDNIDNCSSQSCINTLLSNTDDIIKYAAFLKYDIKTLSDSVRNK